MRKRERETEREKRKRKGERATSIIFKGVLMCKPNFTQSVQITILVICSLYPVVIITADRQTDRHTYTHKHTHMRTHTRLSAALRTQDG